MTKSAVKRRTGKRLNPSRRNEHHDRRVRWQVRRAAAGLCISCGVRKRATKVEKISGQTVKLLKCDHCR